MRRVKTVLFHCLCGGCVTGTRSSPACLSPGLCIPLAGAGFLPGPAAPWQWSQASGYARQRLVGGREILLTSVFEIVQPGVLLNNRMRVFASPKMGIQGN